MASKGTNVTAARSFADPSFSRSAAHRGQSTDVGHQPLAALPSRSGEFTTLTR